jgi:hypothetical protein
MSHAARALSLGLLIAFMVLVTQGDETPTPAKNKAPAEPGTAEVRLADGSTVRMTLAQSSVEITTRFGKLTVPVEDIRRIEFGFRYPDGVKSRVDASITKLGSTEPKERDAAVQELVAFGRMAYPSLKRLQTGPDAELATRAKVVIQNLEEKVGAENLRIQDQDTIHATEFVVTGQIESPTFKGRTSYFGEVTVQVAELKMIRFVGVGGGETDVVVDAAKYAALSRDVWMDTEVDLVEGNTLAITASGIVDLYPSGGNYKIGPDAMPRQGQAPDGTPSGMLLGRIGEKGKPFQIGAKFGGEIKEPGRLYLRIECSPWNNASTGSFTVKINPNADGVTPVAPVPNKKKTFKGAIDKKSEK